ncbi:hypothetical protein HDU97_004979 [Phlyctochytrium planicorne]|nr:hypothetical protein HDU97_004979 [Phlyctochytrium planicorne]
MSTSQHPSQVSMLSRDFIHNSLYNPNYGYFSKNVQIIDSPKIDFTSIKDIYQFWDHVGQVYKDFDTAESSTSGSPQLWHTPSELFNPWYGYAIGRYIVEKAKNEGLDSINVYEIGGGNGTLMHNVMTYIRDNEPLYFKKTNYTIIEISKMLAQKQMQIAKEFAGKVTVENCSFFDWNQVDTEPAFVMAMEVFDNLAHDVIRCDYETGEVYEGIVHISEDGNFWEGYEKVSDGRIRQFLDLAKTFSWSVPKLSSRPLRQLRSLFPFAPNLTQPEFVPTKSLQFFEKLATCFPKHLLVLSDFTELPKAVEGISGPVVQTRYQGSMIACSTYLVQPGWFDIFFPTDFSRLQQMHESICKPAYKHKSSSQHEFLSEFGMLSKTQTKSGENPMLSFYENFKFYRA